MSWQQSPSPGKETATFVEQGTWMWAEIQGPFLSCCHDSKVLCGMGKGIGIGIQGHYSSHNSLSGLGVSDPLLSCYSLTIKWAPRSGW